MIWIVLLVFFVVYLVFAQRVVKRRRGQIKTAQVIEASIDGKGVVKRRADGLEERVVWHDIASIDVIHRVNDARTATDVVSSMVVGRHVPVDEPTLLVFHADDHGAVLPAWPEVVEDLLVHMRHKCSIGTAELQKVSDRIETRQRGTYILWTRGAPDAN